MLDPTRPPKYQERPRLWKVYGLEALNACNAVLEEHDPVFFAQALGNVARAKGMTTIAQKTQLGRQNLYRALSGQSTPCIDTLMKVLDSLGVPFTVVPKTTAVQTQTYAGAVLVGSDQHE